MKNYKLPTLALLLVLPFFITACTLKDLPVIGKYFGEDTSKPVSLNMWGLWERQDVFNTLIEKYKETAPTVSVSYDDRSIMKSAQFKDTLLQRLSSGSSTDIPDIIVVHNTWIPYIKDYLEEAPSDVISSNDYTQTFYPVAAASAVIDNKVYAIPAYYDGLALVYNKDHFDEIDQLTPPTAWEEFRRIALSLTKREDDGNKGYILRSGAAIGTANNIDFFSDILGMMFAQAGVNVPADLSSKPAQDALSFYTAFTTEDKIWDETMPEASTAFSKGLVSMIFVPSWNLLDIIKARPDMNIGVAAVPQAVPENPVAWGSFWMYAVPKTSQNKEAAWKFIKFLSEDNQQLLLFSEASKYRTYGAPYTSQSLGSQITAGPVAKYLKPYIDTAPFAQSSIFAARAGNTMQTDALKEAVNSLISKNTATKTTPEEVLTKVKNTLTGTTTATTNK